MTLYIALLRGINVGGKNIIKMAELKRTFESLGLSRVQTYIQSGNVLFECAEEEEGLLARIERAIQKDYGFAVSVVLRTAAQWNQIAANCPFSEEEVAEAEKTSVGESLYVCLLRAAPSAEGTARLGATSSESDEYRIAGRDIYLLFRSSIRNSKLANNLQKLGVPATVRNWKTINKLHALLKAMDV
jgi:uncharacterized protein (DUF1697 family)